MHYSIIKVDFVDSMNKLKEIFPDGEADEMNFVLFSTSGIHGTSMTIEECEEEKTDVTFLIVHPRTVTLQYGNVKPEADEDWEFLKKLRSSSSEIAAQIGY